MMVLLRPRLGNARVAGLRAGALGTGPTGARGAAAAALLGLGQKIDGHGGVSTNAPLLRQAQTPRAPREVGLLFVLDPARNGLGTRVQPLAPLGVEAVAARHNADDGLNKLR